MANNVINLRDERKKRARAEREKVAAANREKYGRTKAQQTREDVDQSRRQRALDGARIEVEPDPIVEPKPGQDGR